MMTFLGILDQRPQPVIQPRMHIHDVRNIRHGNLNYDNVYLNDSGEVQIGN
jgi:hypothetical protein